MELSGITIGCITFAILCICWFGFQFLTSNPLGNRDICARVTGNCGDTMELSLQLKDQKVHRTRHSSDGCGVSKQCIEAIALEAQGKTLKELEKINMMDVINRVGELPESHLHCAQLAETTLQTALKEYYESHKLPTRS